MKGINKGSNIAFTVIKQQKPFELKLHNLYYLHVTKGCKLPRLSHYPLMSEPLQEKFEIFKTCPEVAKRQSLFKMQPPYKVGRKNSLKDPRRTEHDIMFEIQTHGPVQGMNI